MYESFFGLHQAPFSIAPDPSFLYMSAKHQEALDLLQVGMVRGASFVLLTGEIGAGKTTVWRRFLEDLPGHFDVANVVNPRLDVGALLERVCEDLHVPLPEGTRALDLIDALHGHLLLAHAQGRRTLIVIDEAQALSLDVLEQLRLLTNLDSSGKKLQVMLIGQPELRQILERPELEPLAQRVVARYHLPALSEAETAGYILHRLRVAGLQGALPFDGESIGMIHRLCRGVPRRINTVCDRALAAAAAAGTRRIDRRLVEQAAAEVYGPGAAGSRATAAADGGAGHLPSGSGGARVPAGALLAVAGVALAAGVWLAPQFGGTAATAAAPAPAVTVAAPAAPVVSPPVVAPAAAPAPAAVPTAAPAVVAAAVPAADPAPAPSAPSAAPVSADTLFSAATADEASAWRALAGLWGTVLGAGEPCAAAALQSLHCLRSNAGLAGLRQSDRPAWLRLQDPRGRVAHVLLVGLAADRAVLNAGGADLELPLLQLARLWQGEFATYWRAPAGYVDGAHAANAVVLRGWLLQRLALLDGQGLVADDTALRARVQAFQRAQGLAADGVAGPLTLMQLAALAPDAGRPAEPRLSRTAAVPAVTSGSRPS